MVDFQSRDTRRGPTTDDEDEDEETEATDDETTESADEKAAAADERTTDDRTSDDAGTATERAADEPTPDAGGETASEPRTETGGTESVADEPTQGGADEQTASAGDPLSDPASEDAADTSPSDPLSDPVTEDDAADVGPADDPLDDPVPATDNESPGTHHAEGTGGDPAKGVATDDPEPARSVAVGVITVGTPGESVEETLVTAFESVGHTVAVRERLRGDYDTVQQVADRLVDRADVDVVVTAGGVGIGADEVTIEAVHPLLEKALPGFGEAFRSLLFEVIGTGIVAVRTTAGVANGTLVFCLPGDADAAELAVEEILATEVPELVEHLDG